MINSENTETHYKQKVQRIGDCQMEHEYLLLPRPMDHYGGGSRKIVRAEAVDDLKEQGVYAADIYIHSS